MKCLGKNVILAVEEVEDDNVTSGGIIVPRGKNTDEEYKFTVYMVGASVVNVLPGDVVLKPEVTVLRNTRARAGAPQFDLRLPDGREAIVVEESDIRVVLEETLTVQDKFDHICMGSRLSAVFHEGDVILDGLVFTREELMQIDTSSGLDSISNFNELQKFLEVDS